MNRRLRQLTLITCLLACAGQPQGALPGAPNENRDDSRTARDTIGRYFALLKTGRYEQVYHLLPHSAQKKLSPEELAAGLSRLADLLRFEKIEIGRIEQKDDLIVVGTTTYGRLVKPVMLNDEEVTRGRIISTHYLVREHGSWKIASVSQQSLRLFLTEYPDAAALFSQTHTRFELFSRGKWVRMPGSR